MRRKIIFWLVSVPVNLVFQISASKLLLLFYCKNPEKCLNCVLKAVVVIAEGKKLKT